MDSGKIKTPIFIISFNRYTMLRAVIERLMELKQERIVVIDNHSSYEPLLEYYEEMKRTIEVLRMAENFGHNVMGRLFQDSNFVSKYNLDRCNFIYTDSDILPTKECPPDFIEKFNEILGRHRDIAKVGLSLRIDDLPDSFKAKEGVIIWESQYWAEKIHDQVLGIELFRAAIDTTFACQRANTRPGWTNRSFRTGKPYLAHHLAWYIDSGNLSDEEKYYVETAEKKETHFPSRYKEARG